MSLFRTYNFWKNHNKKRNNNQTHPPMLLPARLQTMVSRVFLRRFTTFRDEKKRGKRPLHNQNTEQGAKLKQPAR
jgi:hypothetical protein